MSITVTCECGRVTKLDPNELPDASHASPPRCPACGRFFADAARRETEAITDALSVPRTFQQTWQSHWQADQAAEPHPLDSAGETAAASLTHDDSSPPITKPRSLWDVMHSAEFATKAASPTESPPTPQAPNAIQASVESWRTQPASAADADSIGQGDVSPPETNSTAAPLKPKGLWNVMRPTEPETVVDEPAVAVPPRAEEAAAREVRTSLAEARDRVVGTTSPPLSVSAFLRRRVSSDLASPCGSRRAVLAFALSVASVLLATLSIQPGWKVRLPSFVVGLIAVLLGFTATGDVRRSRGRLKGTGAAWASIVLGAVGMFLAPMVFANLGERWRENAGREEIILRLKRIGEALDQHHSQLGHYPAAVEFGKVGSNAKVPLHGWMTPLLPYLGHEPVFRNIDPRQPWDSPANQGMMQQIIPEFVIPGRKPIRSPRGFGVTHFAGIGGEDVREPVGLVHFGIFSETGPIKREQITDGSAQTLIAGEINQAIPAWGEPGNIRSIGEGLNREWHGFGNSEGTGAMFLHADGSVKFYSNKVDRRVLEQLSTRDGGE